MYTIEYVYDSGDSFGASPNHTGTLSYKFNTLKLAQDALARMKEHAIWYNNEKQSQYYRDKTIKKTRLAKR